jgi:tripartite-type tricarboxylate transporter receptor subunit TctC
VIITRLNNEVERILALPDFKTRLASDGADAVGGSPQGFHTFLRADIAKWSKVIKSANVQVD